MYLMAYCTALIALIMFLYEFDPGGIVYSLTSICTDVTYNCELIVILTIVLVSVEHICWLSGGSTRECQDEPVW